MRRFLVLLPVILSWGLPATAATSAAGLPYCDPLAAADPPVLQRLCGSMPGAGAAIRQAPLPCAPVPAVRERCEAWVSVFDHAGGHGTLGIDMAFDIVTSRDGGTVFVTGQSWQDAKNHYDFATIAYDTLTGQQRWLARYDGPGDEHDIPQNLALSPDGTRLYVTGWAHMNPVGEGADYATVAYDAATGQQLWDATYDGGGGTDDSSYGIAVSPDGEFVYVTGKSGIQHNDMDFATVAYHADTGERAWVARYSAVAGGSEDIGVSLVVAPDGRTVYVTGAGGTTWTTIAYHAGEAEEDEPEPGTERWRALHQKGYAYWITQSADGSRIYVSGSEHRTGGGTLVPNWDYGVIAYDTENGTQRWIGSYGAPDVGMDVPFGHALSPAGDRIYLTGSSRGAGVELQTDMVTASFSTTDGALAWANRYENPAFAFEGGGDVAVRPNGQQIVTTGWSTAGFGAPGELVVRTLEATAGRPMWTTRFNSFGSPQEQDFGDAIALSPDGSRAFVAGYAQYAMEPDDPTGTQPGDNSSDYLTLSYVL